MMDDTGHHDSKLRVTYVVSEINKSLAFEWIADGLKDSANLDFVLLNNSHSQLAEFLSSRNVPFRTIALEGGVKSLKTIFLLWRHLMRNRTVVIHTHMRKASQIGMLTAYMAGINKRIYTRHSSSYNHLYHPRSVKWDRWTTRLSTDVVAISEVVRSILIEWEKTPQHKVHLIHHGFDLSIFKEVSNERKEVLRKKYLTPPENQGPIVGIISRYMEWKGITYGIQAFKNFKKSHPNAVLILANAKGPFKAEIQRALAHLPAGSYTEIEFEEDIAALYSILDMMIHVPIDPNVEAFGQTYVEALAAGVPSIVTLSGVAHEFIQDGHNALVVPYRDSESILKAMLLLDSDRALRDNLITNGFASVSGFRLEPFIDKLKTLYGN
jgi:glycosyltransferase involved in cell wall biosynthesis